MVTYFFRMLLRRLRNAVKVNMTGTSLINYMKSRFIESPKTYIGIRELQAHYQFKTPPPLDIINRGNQSVDLKSITLRDNVNRAVVEFLKTPDAINSRSLSVISFDFYQPDILPDLIDINTTRKKFLLSNLILKNNNTITQFNDKLI